MESKASEAISDSDKQILSDWVSQNTDWTTIDDLPRDIFIPLMAPFGDDIDKRVEAQVEIINYMKSLGESNVGAESWSQKSSIDRIEALEKLGIKQGDAIKLSGLEFEDFGEDLQGALKDDDEYKEEHGEVENPNIEFQQYYPDYNNIGESQTARTKYECEYCDHGFKSNEALMIHHNDKHAIAPESLDGYASEDDPDFQNDPDFQGYTKDEFGNKVKSHPSQYTASGWDQEKKERMNARGDVDGSEFYASEHNVGDYVTMTDDALDNYGQQYRGQSFRISHVAKSVDDHMGYDEGMGGENLYDLDGFNSSLYDYEVESANESKATETISEDEKDEIFQYLFDLQESGATNMFGSGAYVERDFPHLDKREVGDVITEWMANWDEIATRMGIESYATEEKDVFADIEKYDNDGKTMTPKERWDWTEKRLQQLMAQKGESKANEGGRYVITGGTGDDYWERMDDQTDDLELAKMIADDSKYDPETKYGSIKATVIDLDDNGKVVYTSESKSSEANISKVLREYGVDMEEAQRIADGIGVNVQGLVDSDNFYYYLQEYRAELASIMRDADAEFANYTDKDYEKLGLRKNSKGDWYDPKKNK